MLSNGPAPKPIAPRQGELDTVVAKFLNPSPTLLNSKKSTCSASISVPEYIDRARVAARRRKDPKFAALYHGKWVGGYQSQSEADFALAIELYKLLNRDPARVDRMFRQSGLYREKWDRKSYQQPTLEHAAQSVDSAEWADPLPLSDVQPDPMRPDLISGEIGDHIRALSAWSETPIELATLAVLGSLSCAVGGKLKVSPEPDYLEPCHLFLCPVLESGTRKTSVVSKATEPLTMWEKEQQDAIKPKIAHISSVRKTRLALIERERRTLKVPDPQKIENIAKMEAALPSVPTLPELFTADITSEKLEIMLAEQGGRAALISDEGGIFDVMAGRYNDKLNLDVFLKGHAGSAVRVHRISRDPVIVHHPALTLMVSPQPGILRELGDKNALRDRGLLARFLYALPQSPIGKRLLTPVPMAPKVVSAYDNAIRRLLDWKPDLPVTVTLEENAYTEWKAFQRRIETRMADGGDLCRLRDWGSKLPGAVLRIAGILHVTQNARDLSVMSAEIPLSTFQVAIEVGETLIVHAIAVFAVVREDPATSIAKRLWRWIEAQKKSEVPRRDCFRAHQPHVFEQVTQMNAPLLVLEQHNLIRVSKRRTSGRSTEVIEVNPAMQQGAAQPM